MISPAQQFLITASALIVAGLVQFMLTRWWLARSRKVDPDQCDRRHEDVEARLGRGDEQFNSMLSVINRLDERDVTKSMLLIRICDALNILLPPEHRIPCDDLIDTLRRG